MDEAGKQVESMQFPQGRPVQLAWARCSICARARYRMSLTSVDLPEPDTPVTAVKVPSVV